MPSLAQEDFSWWETAPSVTVALTLSWCNIDSLLISSPFLSLIPSLRRGSLYFLSQLFITMLVFTSCASPLLTSLTGCAWRQRVEDARRLEDSRERGGLEQGEDVVCCPYSVLCACCLCTVCLLSVHCLFMALCPFWWGLRAVCFTFIWCSLFVYCPYTDVFVPLG